MQWRHNPVTQAVMAQLKSRVEATMMRWADGRFTSESVDETVQLNAREIGRVMAWRDVLQTSYTDIAGDTDERN